MSEIASQISLIPSSYPILLSLYPCPSPPDDFPTFEIGFISSRFDFLTDTLENIFREFFMEIKVGEIYIRHSDGQICRVRWIDHTTVVLESEDGSHLSLTTIYGLEKAYSKREVEPIQNIPARLPAEVH
ncbi:MAG: hypothetical protein ACXWMF_04855 [Syntrophales bacterium]